MNTKDIDSTVNETETRLDEGLTELKAKLWPNLDVVTALNLLRYSPDWSNRLLTGRIKLSFKDEGAAKEFEKAVEMIAGNLDQYDSMPQPVKGGDEKRGSVLTVKVEPPKGADEKAAKQHFSEFFTVLMAFAKKSAPEIAKAVKRNDKESTLSFQSEDERTLQDAFVLASLLNSEGPDFIKSYLSAGRSAGQNLKQINDPKSKLSQEEKDRLSEMTAALMDKVAAAQAKFKPGSMTDAQKAEMEKSVSRPEQKAALSAEYQGFVGGLYALSFVAGQINNDGAITQKIADAWVGEAQFDNMFAVPDVTMDFDPDKWVSDGAGTRKEKISDFFGKLQLTGDVTESQRWLLGVVNNALQPKPEGWREKAEAALKDMAKKAKDAEGQEKEQLKARIADIKKSLAEEDVTPAKLRADFDKNLVGFKIALYQKKRRDAIEAIIEKAKADAAEAGAKFDQKDATAKAVETVSEMMPQITSYKSLADLTSALGKVSGIEAVQREKAAQDQTPRPRNACAKRRLMLFDEVKRRGARVVSNADWVMSICDNGKQCSVFGRNKPKCVPNNRSAILEEANLEDDKITPKMKTVRDGSDPWVYDGLSKAMDAQETETSWCTAGAYNNHSRSESNQNAHPWNHTGGSIGYQPDGKHLFQFMDCRDGKLYQIGAGYIFCELDGYGGITQGIDRYASNGIEQLRWLRQKYPTLDQLFVSNGIDDAYFKDRNLHTKTKDEIMQSAVAEGRFCPNGALKIRNETDLETYAALLDDVDTVFVDSNKAVGLFAEYGSEDEGGKALPLIDCQKVKNAANMFTGCRTKSVRLANTGGIEDMMNMFTNAEFETLTGLDTKSAKSITNMFSGCCRRQFQGISVPELDLSSCTFADRAFMNSALLSIKLKNTDKLISAKDAFVGCFMLQKMPDVKFKSVQGLANLRSTAKENPHYQTIFDSCVVLRRKMGAKFTEEIKAVEDWYEKIDQTKVDGRGFFIASSKPDVDANWQKFADMPGVVLSGDALKNTDGLFCEIDGLVIQTLDVNGAEKLDHLFIDCEIAGLNEIIGTDKVKSAAEMFSGSSCNVYPDLNFPALRGEMRVFYNAAAPRAMPHLAYGDGVVEFKDVKVDFDRLDAVDSATYDRLLVRMVGSNQAEAWKTRHRADRPVREMYFRQMAENAEKLAATVSVSEDGACVLPAGASPKYVQLALKKGAFKFSFSKELADEINRKTFSSGIDEHTLPFAGVDFTSEVTSFDFAGVTNAQGAFVGCRTNGILLENTSGIRDMRCMFKACYFQQPLDAFDASSAEDISWMFLNSTGRIGAPLFEPGKKMRFPSAKKADSAFNTCSNLIDVDQLEFPAAESCVCMFEGSPVSVVAVSFPKAVTANCMFKHCSFARQTIGSVDLPEADVLSEMFFGTNAQRAGEIKAPKATNANSMFSVSRTLSVITKLQAPRLTSCQNMFSRCDALVNILVPDFMCGGSATGMFSSCPLLNVYGADGEYLFARRRFAAR